MSENENLRAIILKSLENLDKLIQRENNADKVTKIVVDENNKLMALQEDISSIRDEIKKLTNEKGIILKNAKEEADAIIHQAETKEKEVSDRLMNIKRLERIASEHCEEAGNIKDTHQAMLADITAQKERLKAVLAE